MEPSDPGNNPRDTKELEEAIARITKSLNEIDRQEAKHVEEANRAKKRFAVIISCIGAISLVAIFAALYNLPANSYSDTGYVIENLHGTRTTRWTSWNVAKDQVLDIDIVNRAGIPGGKLAAIEKAIMSNSSDSIPNSRFEKGATGYSAYYEGWEGAIDSIRKKPTTFYLPDRFSFNDLPTMRGDVIIILVNYENSEGLSGFTSNLVDGNQILKSTITIYRAEELSESDLAAITRHEFGHSLGLSHSDDKNDLMSDQFTTGNSLISPCDIDSLFSLYSGSDSSLVACKK